MPLWHASIMTNCVLDEQPAPLLIRNSELASRTCTSDALVEREIFQISFICLDTDKSVFAGARQTL